jgi:hypothetical protein
MPPIHCAGAAKIGPLIAVVTVYAGYGYRLRYRLPVVAVKLDTVAQNKARFRGLAANTSHLLSVAGPLPVTLPACDAGLCRSSELVSAGC